MSVMEQGITNSGVVRSLADVMDRLSLSEEIAIHLASEGVRPKCAFEGCGSGWRKFWKRRPRPMFEGGWGCSRTCVRALVEVALRREVEGAPTFDAAHNIYRHRMPLGLTLLAQGLVTQDQLRRALEAQKAAGRGRIGQWLVEAAGVSEVKVTRGIGMQWQCPVLSTTGFDVARMALAMPAILRELCSVVPVRVAGGRLLYLGFAENVDSAAAFALERMHGMTVENGIVPVAEFDAAVHRLRQTSGVPCREAHARSFDDMVLQIADVLGKLQPVASRLVRLRDRYWLRLWLERGSFGASGMFPLTGEDVVDVLFRMSAD
jgi:hypothetical protein